MLALLLMGLLLYAGDYFVWRVRVARRAGMDTVQITRLSVAPLKAGKEEYYFDGTDTAECTVSLLPPLTAQGWGTPCWWLRRHRQVITRY